METSLRASLPPSEPPELLLAKGTSSLHGGGNFGSAKSLPEQGTAISGCLCCSQQSGSCVGVLVWIKGSVTGQGHKDILLHKTWEM